MVIEKAADVRIEQMRVEDVEAVAELDKKCFPSPWSVSAYMNEAHNPSAYYVVARVDDRIIGFAGMWLIMEEAHITTIGVDPDLRGQKIGERILIHILDEAIHRGARRVTLEVRKSNSMALKLYDKYMFHTVAVRKAYYTNNNEDALVMWIDDMWSGDFLKKLRTRKEELGVSI
mgnify:FL=1